MNNEESDVRSAQPGEGKVITELLWATRLQPPSGAPKLFAARTTRFIVLSEPGEGTGIASVCANGPSSWNNPHTTACVSPEKQDPLASRFE